MSPICSNCGNTNHAPGAVKCAICGAVLPRAPGPRAPAVVATPGVPVLVAPSGRQYRLSTMTPTLIGSRGCAITLSDPGIAPKHAQVSPSGGGYIVQDMGGGTRVNSVPVTGPTPLQPGDTITVGTVNLVYQGRVATGRLTPAPILPPTPQAPSSSSCAADALAAPAHRAFSSTTGACPPVQTWYPGRWSCADRGPRAPGCPSL